MAISDGVKRFCQRNLAGGEWRQHKAAYLGFALAGYLIHMTCCGGPAQGAERSQAQTRLYASSHAETRLYQPSLLERIVEK